MLLSRLLSCWTVFVVHLIVTNASATDSNNLNSLREANKKTSFLILLADDTGIGHFGFGGGVADTPNLNHLLGLSSTIKFTNFHSSPVCSPSRTALVSGQIPDINCVPGVVPGVVARAQMTTYANDATDAGYRTAFYGKWHQGGVPANAVGKRGFQHWLASPSGLLSYDAPCFCQEEECNNRPKNKCNSKECYKTARGYCSARASQNCVRGHMTLADLLDHMANSYTCRMMKGTLDAVDARVLPPAKMHNCLFLADEASGYLRSLQPHDAFLLMVAFHETHKPFVADPIRRVISEQKHGLPSNSPLANYVTVVEAVDEAVGRIYSTLQELDRVKDTFVLFASDNGPETKIQGGVPPNSPLRGLKRSVLEGGIRVPAFISWPERIKQYAEVETVTSLMDIRATIRDIISQQNASVKFVEENLNGISLLPHIADPSNAPNNRTLLICGQVLRLSEHPCQSYAYFSGPYKFIFNKRPAYGVRTALFNIETDPDEKTNIAKREKGVFNRLRKEAQSHAKAVRNKNIGNCRRRGNKKNKNK